MGGLGGVGRGCSASSGGFLGVGIERAQGDSRSGEHSGSRDRFAISRRPGRWGLVAGCGVQGAEFGEHDVGWKVEGAGLGEQRAESGEQRVGAAFGE